jgi:glycerophosphoryl diester phosphodiesterase
MNNHRLFELVTPVVFAHRGASKFAPENTIASFRSALEMGALALELDITLTKDGEVVVIHDDTVDRTTTGGTGAVADLDLAHIQTLDAGAWFSMDFAGEKIPTLQEVFAFVQNKALINIELKNAGKRNPDLVQKAVELVKSMHMQETVIFSSFYPKNVRMVRELLPECPVGLLTLPGIIGKLEILFSAKISPDMIHPHYSSLTAAFIQKQHARLRRVHTYTVNEPALIRKMIDWEVDGFFCDDLITAQRVFTDTH